MGVKSDRGRDQPSPVDTSCMASRAPASSTRGQQLGSGPNKPPGSPGAHPLLPVGLSPGKIPSLGPFLAGPKSTQGTHGGAGRPRDGGLLSTGPLGLGPTQPRLSVKPCSSQPLAKLETRGKPPLTRWAWVPIRWIIAELLFQEMSEGRREKTPEGSPGADHAQRWLDFGSLPGLAFD